jgi:DNA repair protein RadC
MKTWTHKLNGSEFKVMRLNDAGPTVGELTQPQAVVDYLAPKLESSIIYRPDVENMVVIALNTRRAAIGFEIISTGTLDTLLVHPREIFKGLIVMNAAAFILAHNHPSGEPSPSEADIKVTRDLMQASQLMKIELLDHVILGKSTAERAKSWASLRELGYFYN